MPGNQNTIDSLVERLQRNDPTLTQLSPLLYNVLWTRPELPLSEWKKLFDAIEHNTVLNHLCLEGCCIRTPGAQHLARILRKNRRLKYLNIRDNGIDENGMIEITNAVLAHPALESLLLSDCRHYSEYKDEKTFAALIQSFANLIDNTQTLKELELPFIWRRQHHSKLRSLIQSMTGNIFIAYKKPRYPDLSFPEFDILCDRNLAIKMAFDVLEKDLTRDELCQMIPDLVGPWPGNTALRINALTILMANIKPYESTIAQFIYQNDPVHDVYQLLYAEKCALEDMPKQCALMLKTPFSHPKLQAIADKIILNIMNYEQISALFRTSAEKERLYWFQAYQGQKQQNDHVVMYAKHHLQELGVLSKDTDNETFNVQITALKQHMNDYRNTILTKFKQLDTSGQLNNQFYRWFQPNVFNESQNAVADSSYDNGMIHSKCD